MMWFIRFILVCIYVSRKVVLRWSLVQCDWGLIRRNIGNYVKMAFSLFKVEESDSDHFSVRWQYFVILRGFWYLLANVRCVSDMDYCITNLKLPALPKRFWSTEVKMFPLLQIFSKQKEKKTATTSQYKWKYLNLKESAFKHTYAMLFLGLNISKHFKSTNTETLQLI